MTERRVEIAVVGSGPGGAVTAALLAESGREVTVLEEGAELALESCPPFSLQEMSQKYRNGGLTLAWGHPRVQYVEGRVVGGGSEINSGLYHRTPPEILDEWRSEFGLADASEEQMRPYFEANERDLHVGVDGDSLPPQSRKLQRGAQTLGWRSIEVPRWFHQGEKQSMSKTFVRRARAAGCRFVPGTRIETVRRSSTGWELRGVTRGEQGAREFRIGAGEVFVAAGAIQTPALLRRSGLRTNIGNSLSLHPTLKVVAVFPDEVNGDEAGVAAHQVREFSPEISLGCSVSSPPYLALAMCDHGAAAETVVRDWKHALIYYAMTRGGDRGRVRNLPGYHDAWVRYPVSDTELGHLARGLRRLSEALLAAGARELYPSVAGWRIGSAADLEHIPQEVPREGSSLMTIHLFSSCPMGENRRRCAADSYGNVFDAPGLHIADASLLCTAPGVNPQGSVMAFARRKALRFLGQA